MMCNAWVRFLVRFHHRQPFLFCTAQSKTGTDLLKYFHQNTCELDSVLLIQEGQAYTHSDAVLRIFSLLPAPWRWLELARCFPRIITDKCYTLIAKHRYRWFGQYNICPIPSQRIKDQMIE
ncbi:hypothetical protein GP5015_93 [gamma proteobacterium HTCC5015]|nr:hypothetical protein GP5015_93 [gamma proteobacterium HTCC5015]